MLDTVASDLTLPIEWLPEDGGAPAQLIVLFHGWAGDVQAMRPLADALRAAFPRAAILVPQAALKADAPRPGWQWYSIQDLATDAALWGRRVRAAAAFLGPWVRAQQLRLGATPQSTLLGGFSQGGIVSLAMAQAEDGICGRVLSFGGCFVDPPAAAPRHSTLHFLHGRDDKIIPAQRTEQAMAWMQQLGGDATADIAEGIGHVLHPLLIERALHRLSSHIPARTWREALGAAPG